MRYYVRFNKVMLTGIFAGTTMYNEYIPYTDLNMAEIIAATLFASHASNEIRRDIGGNKYQYDNVRLERIKS